MSDNQCVFSCETGRIRTPATITPQKGATIDGIVRLRREVKGRGGGTVIVISGIPLGQKQLKELAGSLKKRCGCGGTCKDSVIEIQGDHRDILLVELQSRGYKVKLAGG